MEDPEKLLFLQEEEPSQKRTKVGDDRSKYVKEACVECKIHHKKCDGSIPCSNCTKKNVNCILAEDKRKRGPST
jgi:hypothetical protein